MKIYHRLVKPIKYFFATTGILSPDRLHGRIKFFFALRRWRKLHK